MKVLLLSCSTGEGHNSAAFALQEELESRGVDCVLADPVAFGSEKARKAVANTYNNIIKNCFKVAKFNFYSCTVIFFDKILKLCFISNINIVNDNLLNTILQIGNSLMDNTVHCHFIKKF